jgi:hypothetical protein
MTTATKLRKAFYQTTGARISAEVTSQGIDVVKGLETFVLTLSGVTEAQCKAVVEACSASAPVGYTSPEERRTLLDSDGLKPNVEASVPL